VTTSVRESAFERIESDGLVSIEQAAARASLGRAVRLRLPLDVLVEPGFLAHVVEAMRDWGAEPALITYEIPAATGRDAVRLRRVARALAACHFGCVPEEYALAS
jgi:hypothetical protein